MEFPQEVLTGDGKQKINLGCATTMFHWGWLNVDVLDVSQFAIAFKYQFKQVDFRNGLPFNTGSIDLIFAHHVLEHVDYQQGRDLLMECRRVLKPESGGLRILVPNAAFLTDRYSNINALSSLWDYDELNAGCANAPTAAGKLWAMLLEGHKAIYDSETLLSVLESVGFVAKQSRFRHAEFPACEQILKETIEMSYGDASLVVDAIPKVG